MDYAYSGSDTREYRTRDHQPGCDDLYSYLPDADASCSFSEFNKGTYS
jgi:hypothetical protein